MLDGDHFVVNGQKTWTSFGHHADFCFGVVRTDPDATKHKGLTYILIDMHSPGVKVRPLKQMTGESEFNEVFFAKRPRPRRKRRGQGQRRVWKYL